MVSSWKGLRPSSRQRRTSRPVDFGRFAWRPAESDFARLAAQQWRDEPCLEAAFFTGYGADPRQQAPQRWCIAMVREAIGTAAWAYQVGNDSFELQGHRMIAEAIAACEGVPRSG